VPAFFEPEELVVLRAVCDRLVPPAPSDGGGGGPGAVAAGVPEAIDRLLGAFEVDPPAIWAATPAADAQGLPVGGFLPLSPAEELAWRTRIEGSRQIPERERLGPVEGWQVRYRRALAALGPDFVDLPGDEQDRRMAAVPDVAGLIYTHCCELLYGPPAYGGNRDRCAWRAIGFAGDVQPRGWTDEEVSGP
jgi:hypothetical protein